MMTAMEGPAENTPWQRGFWYLMGTQFQNAFSDNALKFLIIQLVLDRSMETATRDSYVALAGALFAAPFILFSMLGGWIADRFSKAEVMTRVKIVEVGIMLVATIGLTLGNLPLEMLAIFLMGCHSSIFAPSKYGILPEIVPTSKLSWGNGILELLTFLGVILGTIAGVIFAEHFAGHQLRSGLILVVLAMAGWQLSLRTTRSPAAAPTRPLRLNPIGELYRQLILMKADRDLWRAVWGSTGFFFVATLVQMNLMLYGKDVLHLTQTKNGLLNVALALGIGAGSVFAGYASRGRIEYRLVPIGAVGIFLSAIPLGLPGISLTAFSCTLVTLGFSAGLFIVPIAAVLQHRPAADSKGAVQGAANLLSFIGILAASGVQWIAIQGLHLTHSQVFWLSGACALITGAYAAISRGRFIDDVN